MTEPQSRASVLKKPLLHECPKTFCRHWVEARWGNQVRGRCACEWGDCTRSPSGQGDKDFYEPADDQLRMHGLPWFFFVDPEELLPEQKRRYHKYFEKEHHALLRPGVTGLRLAKRGAAPGFSEHAFNEQAFWLAERCEGAVSEIDTDVRNKSFGFAKITFPDGQALYVVQNVMYPLIACASKIAPFSMTWHAWPEIWTPFSPMSMNGMALEPEHLQLEVTVDWLVALPETERACIRRWRPLTVGELVFNYWDIERFV